jgi:Transglycosylase SLT domain
MADELTTAPLDQAQPLQAQEPSVLDKLAWAVYGQESSYGQNIQTSATGARGPMQIEPGTFVRFAQPGEEIDNFNDNMRVGRRILGHYLQTYGDPARAAVAYYSGESNVAPPDSPTPWVHARSQNGPSVATYVAQVGQRMGDKNIAALGQFTPQSFSGPSSAPLTPEPTLVSTALDFGQDLAKARAASAPAAAGASAAKPFQLPRVPIQTPTLMPVAPPQPIQAPKPLDVYQALLRRQNPLVSNG